MNEKTDQWIKEVKLLSEIAKSEPQCALSCFMSGYKHKLDHYMLGPLSKIWQKIEDSTQSKTDRV